MLALTSTACSDRSLLTADELKAALGSAAPTNDQVTALRGRVEQAICRACRVPGAGVTPPTLRVEALTETFRLKSHQSMLLLGRRPIASVVSVTENDVALVVTTDYEIDVSTGALRRLSSDTEICWPCGKIVVVYTAGWATVPDDLKLAAAKLAQSYWAEGGRTPGLRSQEIPGVLSESYQDKEADNPAIPFDVMQLLGPYINHAVG
jgi:hypothetical protein